MTYLSFQLLPRLPKPVMFNKWALSFLAIHGLNHSSRERVLLPLESILIQLQTLIYVHQLPTLSHFLHCRKHLAGILSVWPPLVIRRVGGSFLLFRRLDPVTLPSVFTSFMCLWDNITEFATGGGLKAEGNLESFASCLLNSYCKGTCALWSLRSHFTNCSHCKISFPSLSPSSDTF